MKHHDLVKNPLFKLVGIILILYFALFSNKSDKRSLGNRYSTQNIKKSIGEAVKQKKEIEEKIRDAKKSKTNLNKIKNSDEKK